MERKRASREEWVAWARDVTCDASARAIAARIGRSHTTVSRWLRDGGSADAVIAIAVGYGAPVVRSLVEMGYLSPEEAERVNVSDMLRTLPNASCIVARSRSGASTARTRSSENVGTPTGHGAQLGFNPAQTAYAPIGRWASFASTAR